MTFDFRGKTALVTGAGRGIGFAIAEALVHAGVRTGLLGPRPATIDAAVSKLAGGPGEAFALHADIRQEDQVTAAFAEIMRRYGRLDLLVNNAGIGGPAARITEITREQWDEVMDINLTGAFLCSREALKIMGPAKAGKIINISSVAGRIGYSLRSPYASSKWAMIGLTRTLAVEWGSSNIQVNAICPGAVEGERIEQVIGNRASASGLPVEEVRKQYTSQAALNRFVTARDVSDLVLYLASPSGDNISGQALDVSAGSYL